VTVSFDPVELPWRETYKLLTGIITPRPIAWVGTRSAEGVANLAPFSFFNVASPEPPVVFFCPTTSEGRGDKDSLVNAREQGCFTISMVSRALADHMNDSSASVGPEVDEFGLAGLTPLEGTVVPAPYVAEAPAAMECRTVEVRTFGRGSVVFGEVVAIHVDEEALDGTRVLSGVLDTIGRLCGPDYVTTRDVFRLVRPA